MRTGLYVLSAFAAAWGMLALNGLGLPAWTWAAPVLITAAVVAYAGPGVSPSAGRPPEGRRRIGRLVALWSGAEGVAIPVSFAVLHNTGHPRMGVPAMALIVGLHFLPLARGLPYRPYYATGAVLSLAAVAAMFAPGPNGPMVAAAGAGAVILWATALAMPALTGRLAD